MGRRLFISTAYTLLLAATLCGAMLLIVARDPGAARSAPLPHPTDVHTATPTPTPSATPTPTVTPTSTATPTSTSVPTSTAVPSSTGVPPAATIDASAPTPTPQPAITPDGTSTPAATPPPGRTATRAAGARSPVASASPPIATQTPLVLPSIACLWALPDMDSGTTGIQYVPAPAQDLHDHDTQAVPDADNNPANGVQAPCVGPPATAPSQPDGARHLMQVVPNLGDLPEPRRVQLWLAVNAPDGMGPAADGMAALWYVYYPDGTPVRGVVATAVPNAGCSANGAAGGPIGSMFEAAAHTGQVSPAAIDDPSIGLVALCGQHALRLFHGEFDLSNDWPCGEYRVAGVAVADAHPTAPLSATFDVMCTVALRIDFNAVDWGALTPGEPKLVRGDGHFAPPDDTAPTVKNAGNDGMGLKLEVSAMTGALLGETIDQFDACFGRVGPLLQCLAPSVPGGIAVFDAAAARVLCANEPGELDVTVHPPATARVDVYRGLITLIGYPIANRCAGHHHLE